ncbi:acyltransferase family protein [Streptomyces sp. NPDC001665]
MATAEILTGPTPATTPGAPPTPQPTPSRLPSLTGLRFPAALAVFTVHAFMPIPPLRLLADDATEFRLFGWFEQAGALGVAFFFVLSGFVLAWSARESDTASGFWRRRFVKIYPNYVLTWLLALLVFAGPSTPTDVSVANLFMVQVWVPDYFTNFSVNSPGWSLGVEALFYLSFPLLFAFFRRVDPARLKYWITGALAVVMATPAVAYALFPAAPLVPSGQDLSVPAYWFGYVLPPLRLFDFALGILAALAVKHGRWRDIGMIPSFLLLAAGYWLTYHVPFLYGQRATMIIPIVLLIAATATADIKGRFTLFRNRAMVRLGEISFAFYLLHYPVLMGLRKALGTEMYSNAAGLSILAAAAVGTVALSWVLYIAVEAPLVRRFGRVKPRAKTG